MLSKILTNFESWEHLGVVESETGSRLIAHTPRKAPQAYLHRFFAPVPATSWKGYPLEIPPQLRKLYSECNGLSLFGGSLSLWGIRAHYKRDSSAQLQPFDLAAHSAEWLYVSRDQGWHAPEGTIFFGSYSWDGSGVFMSGEEPEVYRMPRGTSKPANVWPNLASFVTSEYDRIDRLFSRDGYRIDEGTPTTPERAP